jgi:hypothetical protein
MADWPYIKLFRAKSKMDAMGWNYRGFINYPEMRDWIKGKLKVEWTPE